MPFGGRCFFRAPIPAFGPSPILLTMNYMQIKKISERMNLVDRFAFFRMDVSQRNILDYRTVFLDMGFLKRLKETTEKAVDKGAELGRKGIEKGAEVGTKAYDGAKEAAEKGHHKAREGKKDQK